MDVPNFVGSKYRRRSEFRPEEEQADEGMSPQQLLDRVLTVVERIPVAKEAVRLELERIVYGENRPLEGAPAIQDDLVLRLIFRLPDSGISNYLLSGLSE